MKRANAMAQGALLCALSGALCCRATVPAALHGSDLGTLGPTYEITEPDFLAFIQQRLREKERSGEIERLRKQAVARGTAAVRNPKPAPGLRTTSVARTLYFDPTFTLDHNITDAAGRLLFASGARANPLDVVSLSKHLLFIDARDPRQVKQARRLMDAYGGRVKLILTAGSYLDLMKAWRRPVYYDQDGRLTRRLGISQVPALVSQEGARLRIDEVEVQP